MSKLRLRQLIIGIGVLSIFLACSEESSDYYPKPRGYMRLDFPERKYSIFAPDSCPFQFETADYFRVIQKENCNSDIQMDRFNATLFLTYMPIDSNLMMNIEYSRKLVYEHSIKADAIEEVPVLNPKNSTYGLKYNIKGDAASPFQFYVTDSTHHFLRGALYFNVKPNYDSIRSSLDYVVEDIDQLLKTITWKNEPN